LQHLIVQQRKGYEHRSNIYDKLPILPGLIVRLKYIIRLWLKLILSKLYICYSSK